MRDYESWEDDDHASSEVDALAADARHTARLIRLGICLRCEGRGCAFCALHPPTAEANDSTNE